MEWDEPKAKVPPSHRLVFFLFTLVAAMVTIVLLR